MNPMNLRRRVACGVVLGVIFILLEFLVHGVLLSGVYKQNALVWRPEDQMKNLFPLMFVGQFLFGVFFGLVYAQGYEPRRGPVGQGFRYGLIMGMMLAPMNSLGWYVILPIPSSLGVQWFVAGFAEMVLLGLAASVIYKPAE